MRKTIAPVIIMLFIFLYGCNSDDDYAGPNDNKAIAVSIPKDVMANAYDANTGAGKFKNIVITNNLNNTMASAGEKIYNDKCVSCHKLNDEKLVGPGWAEVTKRHQPAWIMNFITNTDEMLGKDPSAIAQLKSCLVRMPNQNLADEDVRNVVEFMRKNDGGK